MNPPTRPQKETTSELIAAIATPATVKPSAVAPAAERESAASPPPVTPVAPPAWAKKGRTSGRYSTLPQNPR